MWTASSRHGHQFFNRKSSSPLTIRAPWIYPHRRWLPACNPIRGGKDVNDPAGYPLRDTPIAQGSGLHHDGSTDARTGYRCEHGDLHAGACRDAEVAAGGQSLTAVPHWRLRYLLRLRRPSRTKTADGGCFPMGCISTSATTRRSSRSIAAFQANQPPVSVRRAGSQSQPRPSPANSSPEITFRPSAFSPTPDAC